MVYDFSTVQIDQLGARSEFCAWVVGLKACAITTTVSITPENNQLISAGFVGMGYHNPAEILYPRSKSLQLLEIEKTNSNCSKTL